MKTQTEQPKSKGFPPSWRKHLVVSKEPPKTTVMRFKVCADSSTFEGDFKVENDDGTTHLPMMVHGLMKQLSTSHPRINTAKKITIEATL